MRPYQKFADQLPCPPKLAAPELIISKEIFYWQFLESLKFFQSLTFKTFKLKKQFPGADILLIAFSTYEIRCCCIGSQCHQVMIHSQDTIKKVVSTTADGITT